MCASRNSLTLLFLMLLVHICRGHRGALNILVEPADFAEDVSPESLQTAAGASVLAKGVRAPSKQQAR